MSSPSRMTWPLVGVSRPASSPRSVLFPLPDGPMMAANWPLGDLQIDAFQDIHTVGSGVDGLGESANLDQAFIMAFRC